MTIRNARSAEPWKMSGEQTQAVINHVIAGHREYQRKKDPPSFSWEHVVEAAVALGIVVPAPQADEPAGRVQEASCASSGVVAEQTEANHGYDLLQRVGEILGCPAGTSILAHARVIAKERLAALSAHPSAEQTALGKSAHASSAPRGEA